MIEFLQAFLLWLVQRVWNAVPLLFALTLLALSNVPMNLMQGIAPAPDLALIIVFFWAIHGPSFFPPSSVFVLGLMQDLLTGMPPGFFALIYLVAYAFTLSQRIFFRGRTGIGVWLGFGIAAIMTAALSWVAGLLVFARWIDPLEIVLQACVSVLFYPLISRLLLGFRGLLTTVPEAP